MSISEKVVTRLHRMQRSKPFSITGFYTLGPRTSIQKSFSRLTKSGEIVRVGKGLYVRPKPLESIPTIKVTTSADQVARTWAREHGYTLVPQGLEEAYRLGLQTQAPVKTVFWSNGPSRSFKIGNESVEVKQVTDKKLKWAETTEGALLRGFLVLSPSSVGKAEMQAALARLKIPEEGYSAVFKKLKSALASKAWQAQLEELEGQFI
jgi:hypothetical protein